MDIGSAGATAAEISKVSSPYSGHTRRHCTVTESGIASLVPIEKLGVPPGERLALEPGGTHLMLSDPLCPLYEGETMTLTRQDTKGHARTFAVPVIGETAGVARHHR